jgi:multidrug efflux pump subunit AcrA (membrane-fusion protein)
VAVHEGALAVPEESIVGNEHDSEGRGLYLFGSGGKAKRVTVTLGPRIDNRVVVTSGLEPGDEVIVVGHHGLKTGDKVERVTRDKPTPRKAAKTQTEARHQAESTP